MLLFGGREEPRQISEFYSWEKSITRRIRSLPFDFYGGKCIYNYGTVYLCFDIYEQKLCRYRYIFVCIILSKTRICSSDLIHFLSLETNVEHFNGGIEIFLSNPVAIGGQSTNKVEVLNNNKWENKTSIGNGTEEVPYFCFSTIVIKENKKEFLFVFGKNIKYSTHFRTVTPELLQIPGLLRFLGIFFISSDCYTFSENNFFSVDFLLIFLITLL